MSDEIIPQNEPQIELFNESQDILPIPEPIQAPEPQTAQIPVNEPLPPSVETP